MLALGALLAQRLPRLEAEQLLARALCCCRSVCGPGPFVLMVHNGWERQNLLADHHFEEEAPKLNEAGRIKARWIATQAPRHHRALYVSRAETAEETVARVAAVQEYVAQVVPEGEKPAVIETDLDALGWPAAQVDSIDRQWQESTPAPRLPETQSSSVSAQ